MDQQVNTIDRNALYQLNSRGDDVMDAAFYESFDFGVGYCKYAAIKYIRRAGHKDDTVKDLKKAINCLQRLIEKLEVGR